MSGTSPDDLPSFDEQATDPLANAMQRMGVDDGLPDELEPSYRVRGDTKVAVSKSRGKLWKSRKDAAQKSMKDLIDAWDEAIKYYNHDQSDHRTDNMFGGSGNRSAARRLNERHSATENIVYSNVNAQVPELYAKNPVIEVTAGSNIGSEEEWQQHSAFARALERLVNVLFAMRAVPGVNIKAKAKRAVVIALLTNRAWFEVGYITKEQSSDNAQQDLISLSEALVAAKSPKEIREIEGKLFALEERVEFLRPSGPTVNLRLPHQVVIDPDHNDPWLTDANWVMIEDMMPTDYINAVYGQADPNDPDTDRIMSVYEPTHILDGGGDGEQETFSLFDTNKDYNAYGFADKATFDKAKRTKVWRVWDKTTRRLELYSDKDWTWPIWVWDDPYQLDTFFPLTPLWFHENPVAVFAKGEVSYYLDQADMLNEINDERRRALLWARRNIFYDQNRVKRDEVDKVLKGPDATAVGIDVPEGMKPTDIIFSIPPPSMNWAQLFDKKDIYDAVDRIAATNDAMRGEQFKTNTTNKAIEYYSTLGNMRMDERLDAVEECIGDVGWKIAQLCLRFMPADVVQQLIGMDVSQFWQPIDSLHGYNQYNMAVVGGSTQKLSTAQKKQEAVQVGQVLSQFARAAPASVLKTTLRLFSQAFDGMEIREEDWDAIAAEAAAAVGAGPSPSSAGGGTQGNAGEPGSSSTPMPGGGNGAGEVVAIAQALQQLPPQLLQAIGMMLARGVPPMAIAERLITSQQQAGAGP